MATKTKKIEIIPGGVYTIEEFASTLRKKENAKAKFIKENSEGWYSHTLGKYIDGSFFKSLIEVVGDEERIYGYFNTNYMPINILLTAIGEDVEKVESNNIYSLMAAKTITHFRGSFQITVAYGKEPITVVREFSKDTTLNMRDINSFM